MKPILHVFGMVIGMAIFFTLLWEAGCLARRGVMFVLSHAWGLLWSKGHATDFGSIVFLGLFLWACSLWPARKAD
jgi:hypothetical protein